MSSQLSAIELLKLGDEDRKKPWLNKYMPQIFGVLFGAGGATFINFGTKRPLYSGIHKHFIAAAVCSVLFTYYEKYRQDYFAEKDAVLRHYVELHPEDFPTPGRKKLADVFEPWIPVR